MEGYHLRRKDKAITDEGVLREIIEGQKFMTLAMCQGDEPYLATLSYGYDADANCFYFHCAQAGRKIDVLTANPVVWGQIIEDGGYLPGQCDHAFRTVQFRGRVTFLEEMEEKRHALTLMIDVLEPDPGPVKERLLVDKRVGPVRVGKVTVELMTGKQSPI